MRTTIDIDDGVLTQLKRVAADEGGTLRSVIHDALRAELARRRLREGEQQASVITFKGRGVQPGVDIDSNADLLDLMEGKE